MISLFIWCVIGIVIRALFTLAFSVKPDKRAIITMTVLAVAVAAVATYFISQANLNGWLLKAVCASGGFLMIYLLEKLNKIKL